MSQYLPNNQVKLAALYFLVLTRTARGSMDVSKNENIFLDDFGLIVSFQAVVICLTLTARGSTLVVRI